MNNVYFKDAHGPGNLSERMSIAQGVIVFFQGNLFFNLMLVLQRDSKWAINPLKQSRSND